MARDTDRTTRSRLEIETREPADEHEVLVDTDTDTVAAFFGRASRGGGGEWEPAEHVRVVACMGRATLDFTQALLPAGITDVSVLTFCGRIEVTVPRGVEVDVSGTAFLGGIDHREARGGRFLRYLREKVGESDRESEALPEDAPILRVRGAAILGRVDVRVR